MEKLVKSFDYCGFNVKLYENEEGYIFFRIYEYDESNILDGEIYNNEDDACFDNLDAEDMAKEYIDEHYLN